MKQSPPDIKKYRPEIDSDLKKFIDDSLIKDPKKRISDWKMIKTLLRPRAISDLPPVNKDEIAFITRIQNNSYQNVAMIVNKLIKIMDESDISHSVEILKQNSSDDE